MKSNELFCHEAWANTRRQCRKIKGLVKSTPLFCKSVQERQSVTKLQRPQATSTLSAPIFACGDSSNNTSLLVAHQHCKVANTSSKAWCSGWKA
eukprot:1161540-Pelagomonas_calceolata.AAC.9